MFVILLVVYNWYLPSIHFNNLYLFNPVYVWSRIVFS